MSNSSLIGLIDSYPTEKSAFRLSSKSLLVLTVLSLVSLGEIITGIACGSALLVANGFYKAEAILTLFAEIFCIFGAAYHACYAFGPGKFRHLFVYSFQFIIATISLAVIIIACSISRSINAFTALIVSTLLLGVLAIVTGALHFHTDDTQRPTRSIPHSLPLPPAHTQSIDMSLPSTSKEFDVLDHLELGKMEEPGSNISSESKFDERQSASFDFLDIYGKGTPSLSNESSEIVLTESPYEKKYSHSTQTHTHTHTHRKADDSSYQQILQSVNFQANEGDIQLRLICNRMTDNGDKDVHYWFQIVFHHWSSIMHYPSLTSQFELRLTSVSCPTMKPITFSFHAVGCDNSMHQCTIENEESEKKECEELREYLRTTEAFCPSKLLESSGDERNNGDAHDDLWDVELLYSRNGAVMNLPGSNRLGFLPQLESFRYQVIIPYCHPSKVIGGESNISRKVEDDEEKEKEEDEHKEEHKETFIHEHTYRTPNKPMPFIPVSASLSSSTQRFPHMTQHASKFLMMKPKPQHMNEEDNVKKCVSFLLPEKPVIGRDILLTHILTILALCVMEYGTTITTTAAATTSPAIVCWWIDTCLSIGIAYLSIRKALYSMHAISHILLDICPNRQLVYDITRRIEHQTPSSHTHSTTAHPVSSYPFFTAKVKDIRLWTIHPPHGYALMVHIIVQPRQPQKMEGTTTGLPPVSIEEIREYFSILLHTVYPMIVHSSIDIVYSQYDDHILRQQVVRSALPPKEVEEEEVVVEEKEMIEEEKDMMVYHPPHGTSRNESSHHEYPILCGSKAEEHFTFNTWIASESKEILLSSNSSGNSGGNGSSGSLPYLKSIDPMIEMSSTLPHPPRPPRYTTTTTTATSTATNIPRHRQQQQRNKLRVKKKEWSSSSSSCSSSSSSLDLLPSSSVLLTLSSNHNTSVSTTTTPSSSTSNSSNSDDHGLTNGMSSLSSPATTTTTTTTTTSEDVPPSIPSTTTEHSLLPSTSAAAASYLLLNPKFLFPTPSMYSISNSTSTSGSSSSRSTMYLPGRNHYTTPMNHSTDTTTNTTTNTTTTTASSVSIPASTMRRKRSAASLQPINNASTKTFSAKKKTNRTDTDTDEEDADTADSHHQYPIRHIPLLDEENITGMEAEKAYIFFGTSSTSPGTTGTGLAVKSSVDEKTTTTAAAVVAVDSRTCGTEKVGYSDSHHAAHTATTAGAYCNTALHPYHALDAHTFPFRTPSSVSNLS